MPQAVYAFFQNLKSKVLVTLCRKVITAGRSDACEGLIQADWQCTFIRCFSFKYCDKLCANSYAMIEVAELVILLFNLLCVLNFSEAP